MKQPFDDNFSSPCIINSNNNFFNNYYDNSWIIHVLDILQCEKSPAYFLKINIVAQYEYRA